MTKAQTRDMRAYQGIMNIISVKFYSAPYTLIPCYVMIECRGLCQGEQSTSPDTDLCQPRHEVSSQHSRQGE